MGGFLGLGNSSARTDRGNQLAGIGAEWNVYNRGLPFSDKAAEEGQKTVASGITGLEQAKKYWQDIMSGSRPAVMKVAAPAISAVNEQADATRTQQAEMGTSRGGGVNALNQAAETGRMTDVNKLIFGIQPQAAEETAKVSQAEAGAGEAQVRDALSALGISKDVADEIVNSSMQSREISMKARNEVMQMWSNALAALGL